MTPFHRYILPFLLTVTVILGTQAQTTASSAQSTSSTAKSNGYSVQSNTTTTQSAETSYMREVKVDNPIYIGFNLIDEPTVETMSEMCEYYGLTPESTTDGYTAYRASDGTLIRFKQSDDPTVGVNGNLIEIQTKASQKTLNKILSTLNYKKINNNKGHRIIYECGSRQARNLIRCTLLNSKVKKLNFRAVDNSF